MQFIQCKNCDTIIAVKDLKIPFAPELLNGANSENTVKGNDLCADCAEAQEAARKAAEQAAKTETEGANAITEGDNAKS